PGYRALPREKFPNRGLSPCKGGNGPAPTGLTPARSTAAPHALLCLPPGRPTPAAGRVWMKRRSFLGKAIAGAAVGSLAAPAIAQSQPVIHWRMAASWPKSLDTVFGGAELIARRVAEMTGGRFRIRAFAGGEIVPAVQVLDAVQAGTVEMGHTASYYYFGKDPAFSLATSVPFGPNARQSYAWWHF